MFGLFKKKSKELFDQLDMNSLPVHIGIIMDGNGRWAKKRGLPRSAGHRMGAKVLEQITRDAGHLGIKFLTVYAFSTENWARPKDEVDALMKLLGEYLDDYKTIYDLIYTIKHNKIEARMAKATDPGEIFDLIKQKNKLTEDRKEWLSKT